MPRNLELRFATAGRLRPAGGTPRLWLGRSKTTGNPTLCGYGAVFFDPSDAGTRYELIPGLSYEIIDPAAFDAALERGDDARSLFNHCNNNLLGRFKAGSLRLAVDNVGLRYSVDVPDTLVAADVAEMVRRGDLTGSSFGFIADAQEWTTTTVPARSHLGRQHDAMARTLFRAGEKGARSTDGDERTIDVRIIKSLTLFDVSPVTYPAYAATENDPLTVSSRSATSPVRRWPDPAVRCNDVMRSATRREMSRRAEYAVTGRGHNARCRPLAGLIEAGIKAAEQRGDRRAADRMSAIMEPRALSRLADAGGHPCLVTDLRGQRKTQYGSTRADAAARISAIQSSRYPGGQRPAADPFGLDFGAVTPCACLTLNGTCIYCSHMNAAVVYALLEAARRIEGRLEEALAGVKLSGAKFAALNVLTSQPEPMTFSALAEQLTCVRSNVTQLVDRLEAEGLVKRTYDPADRRGVRAELTPLGRQRHAAGQKAAGAILKNVSKELSIIDTDALMRALAAIR